MLKHFLKTFTALIVTLLLVSGVQAEISVAYVDAARLLKDAPQVEQIRFRIRKEFEARDQRLIEMRKQIGLLEERLISDGERMPIEERQRMQDEVSNRRLQLKDARDDLEQDKQLRFSEEEEHFSRIIHEVIQQVAQDENLDLVLQGGVFWVSPKVNITDRVLGRLREMLESGT